MSDKSKKDEQYEDIEGSHSSSEEKESSGDEFTGFLPGTRLHYRVESDPGGASQIIPDIASGSHTEDLLDKSIHEIDETWQDLESIADRLGQLTPLGREDTEWELGFFPKEKSDKPQGETAVSRDSLVSQRILLFEDLLAGATATMSLTSTTTSTTTTTTTSIAGTTPIMRTGLGTASDLYGIGQPSHHLVRQDYRMVVLLRR